MSEVRNQEDLLKNQPVVSPDDESDGMEPVKPKKIRKWRTLQDYLKEEEDIQLSMLRKNITADQMIKLEQRAKERGMTLDQLLQKIIDGNLIVNDVVDGDF